MPPTPPVTFFIHGRAEGWEGGRAHGLARSLDPATTRFKFREPSKLGTAISWMREASVDPDRVLYVLNTALPGALLAPWWSVLQRRRYILDTGDAVYEMAREAGVDASWRHPFMWAIEQGAHRNARAIVVRGTRHRELLRSRGLRRVEVIRDGYAEQSGSSPATVEVLRRRLGLGNEFILGVMGSTVWSPRLQICYGWDLLEALVHLRDLPVRGLVIGDGNGLPWLHRRAAELGVADRVLFTGRVPYAEVPTYLRLMDAAMSTQTNNIPGRVRTTGKLPEYMAAERFILASRVGEAALMLPELMLLDFEGTVDRQYPRRVADRVRLLVQKPELRELRRSLPNTVRALCDYTVLSQRLKLLLETLP